MKDKINHRIGGLIDHRIDGEEDSRLNGHIKIQATPKKLPPKRRKIGLILSLVLLVVVLGSLVVYLFSTGEMGVGAQTQPETAVSRQMIEELRKEQKILEAEKLRLQEMEQNLKNFESELDRKFSEVAQKEKALTLREEAFDKKVADKTVDRQTLETYESIDPEQAAELMKNLYLKDPQLATLLMRKIAGKKAGKILEAMIPLDKEVATQLAKQTLDYYKPDVQ